ncbi:hypothetical protein [Paracoccus alkanivorans]|uniref:DUF3617 family protein n=1 Tax=Paracoccus alkanivorans TaxID=2116655 RepID=A0A3M0M7C7_9RHOB|nr:hypothetical protein [Paracoccus alkanivorans]RMC33626.1 hypothetical protein C9E81_15025 [Paracoccus alkanivorans]
MKLKTVISIPVIALLAACGTSASNNPNSFRVDLDDNKLTGKYNASGFSSNEVKEVLALECKGSSLSGYGEQASADGLVAFTATCAGGNLHSAGGMTVERTENNEILVEITGADESGDLVYTRYTNGVREVAQGL